MSETWVPKAGNLCTILDGLYRNEIATLLYMVDDNWKVRLHQERPNAVEYDYRSFQLGPPPKEPLAKENPKHPTMLWIDLKCFNGLVRAAQLLEQAGAIWDDQAREGLMLARQLGYIGPGPAAAVISLVPEKEFMRTFTGAEGRPCSLCVYQDGKFTTRCSMHETIRGLEDALRTTKAQLEANKECSVDFPVPMILHCPDCHERHIDQGKLARTDHRTHACQFCGFLWAPAVVPTVGVQFLPGCKNKDSE